VAPAFTASSDFAITKPAGHPCPNLRPDFRCGIHNRLRERGFPGCTTFDCFGAGQRVTQVTFGGRDWRRHPELAGAMFATFAVQRHLHELLWYLTEAVRREPLAPARAELAAVGAYVRELTGADPDSLAALDVPELRERASVLLRATSARVRAGGRAGADTTTGRAGVDLAGADLVGADLRRTDLRRASLRAALLIGADLRGADLTLADLTGADLRGARLAGADLSGSLFATQSQLDAGLGDATTQLPDGLRRPTHWQSVPTRPRPHRR
jgi:uncharacterized protein YjbI with pentapeptide repeats